MEDYLTILEKFDNLKEITDLIAEVGKLRFYYATAQFNEMIVHIRYLTKKYLIESAIWNAASVNQPTTLEQAYSNAEIF